MNLENIHMRCIRCVLYLSWCGTVWIIMVKVAVWRRQNQAKCPVDNDPGHTHNRENLISQHLEILEVAITIKWHYELENFVIWWSSWRTWQSSAKRLISFSFNWLRWRTARRTTCNQSILSFFLSLRWLIDWVWFGDAFLEEGNRHGEDHPDVDPLHIGGHKVWLRNPDEAAICDFGKNSKFLSDIMVASVRCFNIYIT